MKFIFIPHWVEIKKGFYMSVYEVTQEQYSSIIGINHSYFKGHKLPVERVSAGGAVGFCRELSQKTGKKVRLPTEEEWEYACRAGTATEFNTGNTISTDQANYNGNYVYGNGMKGLYREKTTKVGSFQPNAFGLYDMHGNVSEWCDDFFHVEPIGSEPGITFVPVRGGSWGNSPITCRSAYQIKWSAIYSSKTIGFRVILEIKEFMMPISSIGRDSREKVIRSSESDLKRLKQEQRDFYIENPDVYLMQKAIEKYKKEHPEYNEN